MRVWGVAVVQRLRALGLDVERCRVGDDLVVFEPDGRLALTLSPEHVEVALEVPPGDLPKARARLDDPRRTPGLVAAVEALPEQFELGASGDPDRAPASRATAEDLRALFERAERELQCVWLGWRVPRAVAVEHAGVLDEQLEDALVALGSVLHLLGAPPGADSPDARRDRRQARRDDEAHSTRRRTRARVREREPETEREVDVPVEPAPAGPESVAPRLLRPALIRKPLRAAVRRPAPVVINKGARVRVLEGPFAGKEGIVQELDGKGGARVMLGLLAVRVDVKDLAGRDEGRGRLRLGSSHRKPTPVRS
jgi:KOW motif